MKIALIRRKYDALGGGAEKYMHNVSVGLLQRGHELTLFAERVSNLPAGLEWVPVPKPRIPSLCSAAAFHKAAQRAVSKRHFDVVYALCRTWPSDLLRVTEQIHAAWLPIRYSAFARLNPRHRGIIQLEKQSLSSRHTRYVVTNSELVKRQIVSLFGYPGDRVFVIRNGVDHDEFFPPPSPALRLSARQGLGVRPDKIVLLFAAANFRIKGLDSALSAIARIPGEIRSRVVMVVVGGDKPDRYLLQAKQLALDSQVIFLGKCREMRSLYWAADLLFYPSLYEPFANVCLEACACGLPVLTTALNGSSELIVNGRNGHVVRDSDALMEMSGFLGEFASFSTERRAEFSQAAIEAAQALSWTRHLDGLEMLFARLLSDKA
ncbi:MAG: hypothetical protein A2X49_14900 [Lentisphaerae bacterium GWF2_52_8]|nr:MAG: hypothetical protein A2X49_14900 [Lentisphaerae bacterium GWF2_52_8]